MLEFVLITRIIFLGILCPESKERLHKVYITKQDKFVMEKELKRARFVGWGLNQREEIHI